MVRSMHDTIYVKNKSLHQTLKNITLEEVFTGMKPEIEHFRLFGCLVYLCTQREEVQSRYFRKKGYSESSKKF
jgi:hypothetical protein